MSRRRKETGRLHDWVSIGRIVVLLVVVVLVFVVKGWLDDSSAEIATEGETRMSPTQIEEMRQIGEWEFLSIADEELVDTVRPLLKSYQEKKELSMVFQALRIEVNGELDALRRLLSQSLEVLNPGGRLAIITYHSLEDRLVKNFMRAGNVEGRLEKDFYGRVNTPWRMVNNKVIVPSEEEVERNSRSRSAKLRVAELIARPQNENSKH